MASTLAAEKLLTAEEFAKLPDNGKRIELVRGRVVEMDVPGPRYGQIAIMIARIIGRYLDEHDIGHLIGSDSGVRTERDPDSVRGPDMAYFSYNRYPRGPVPEVYTDAVPEIAFEVRSPGDRWPPLMAKVAEYLNAGVKYVCVLDGSTRTIRVHTADDPGKTLDANAELTFPDILPGFSVRVGQFFE